MVLPVLLVRTRSRILDHLTWKRQYCGTVMICGGSGSDFRIQTILISIPKTKNFTKSCLFCVRSSLFSRNFAFHFWLKFFLLHLCWICIQFRFRNQIRTRTVMHSGSVFGSAKTKSSGSCSTGSGSTKPGKGTWHNRFPVWFCFL